jgi:hypothetical protein
VYFGKRKRNIYVMKLLSKLEYARYTNWLNSEYNSGAITKKQISETLCIDFTKVDYDDYFANCLYSPKPINENISYESFKLRNELLSEKVLTNFSVSLRPIFYDDASFGLANQASNCSVYATQYSTEEMVYVIFPNDDLTKQAIAVLLINMNPFEHIRHKDVHQVSAVYIGPRFRGKGLSAMLHQTVIRKLGIPLVCDWALTNSGVINLKRLVDSGIFEVSYLDMHTDNISVNQPNDIWTTSKNPYQVILEAARMGSKNAIYTNSTIFV